MVTETTAATAASAATDAQRVGAAVEAERAETALSDFDDFLTLLTAQMKNQDPLKPLDSTQFVEQLATFSAVEQQVGTNHKLNTLIDQGNAERIGALGGWVGQTVEAEKSLFVLDADGMTVPVPDAEGAASTEAIIRDASGDEVARLPVEKPAEGFTWTGAIPNQRDAKAGNYAISFVHSYKDGATLNVEPPAQGRVIEARFDEDGTVLQLESGQIVRSADVVALKTSPAEEVASAE